MGKIPGGEKSGGENFCEENSVCGLQTWNCKAN